LSMQAVARSSPRTQISVNANASLKHAGFNTAFSAPTMCKRNVRRSLAFTRLVVNVRERRRKKIKDKGNKLEIA
jgi:hypothetical protein